ncbi:hypothetical protein [Pseudochelatococcus contaminans]|uniref:Uncharacterized protein n=1 Tax=Pseudochelatococcus contaminans TaxID=1538103 RepID=A0A7W6EFG0_9HYPH|nr:hypothetical protein [Pseudochelatococcus contaminans]MBB3808834.1 hypothetical protein [Pseudochelatococcus contaminans]
MRMVSCDNSVMRTVARQVVRLRWPTTQEFAALHDHARLPWRFFGRFSASLAAGLSR